MAILDKFKSESSEKHEHSLELPGREVEEQHGDKSVVETTNTALNTGDDEDDSDSVQDGVKRAQATTIVWSRNSLIVAYGLYVEPLQ